MRSNTTQFSEFKRPFAGLRAAMTLFETVVVLSITVSAIVYGAQIYSNYLSGLINQAAATQLVNLTTGYAKYLQDNYASVLSSVPSGGYTTIPLATLQPQYISSAFVNKNPYEQSYVLAVRQPVAGNNALEAIIYTTGGEVIANQNALSISQQVGSGGGYTLAKGDGITVQSTYAGYNLSLASYGGSGLGKLVSALFINQLGSQVSDYYLSRNLVSGRPELNQMNTNLDMHSNAISGASGITAATGNIVATTGIVQGTQVTSSNNVTAGALLIGGTGIQSNGPVTSVGSIQSQSSVQGASLVSLGVVTSAGNVTAGGSVEAASVISDSTIAAGSNVIAAQNITSTSGNIQAATGTVEGNMIKSDTTVTLALGQAVKGGGCTMGTIGLDVVGKLYSCVGSIWLASAGYNAVVYGPLRSFSYSGSPQSHTDSLGGPYSICVLSYVQADQNSSVCQVYQSGSTWYQYAASAANAAVGCQSICIPQ
jgi:hypothetical protein